MTFVVFGGLFIYRRKMMEEEKSVQYILNENKEIVAIPKDEADMLIVAAQYKNKIPDYIYHKLLEVEIKPY